LQFLQMSVTQSHHCAVVVWARWSMLVWGYTHTMAIQSLKLTPRTGAMKSTC